MIVPQCMKVVYSPRMVASCPPCTFCALVVAVTVLFAIAPFIHSPPSVSMNARIWLVAEP